MRWFARVGALRVLVAGAAVLASLLLLGVCFCETRTVYELDWLVLLAGLLVVDVSTGRLVELATGVCVVLEICALLTVDCGRLLVVVVVVVVVVVGAFVVVVVGVLVVVVDAKVVGVVGLGSVLRVAAGKLRVLPLGVSFLADSLSEFM